MSLAQNESQFSVEFSGDGSRRLEPRQNKDRHPDVKDCYIPIRSLSAYPIALGMSCPILSK